MVELEHEVRGTGEPVVLVHAGVFADWFEPLMAEPALRARHRLVHYHRVGYAGSDRVAGPGWRQVLDDALPGAFDRAVADAGTFFDQELPAVMAWPFGPAEAARVTQPVLAVLGGDSNLVSPVWGERQALLEAWLGDVEPFVLEGTTHLLHLQRPRAMAETLAGFFARHPLTSP
jgi:pimeloyl-ACP methyl ester carboxylesterase